MNQERTAVAMFSGGDYSPRATVARRDHYRSDSVEPVRRRGILRRMSYNPRPRRFRDLSAEGRRLLALLRAEPFCELRDLHVVGGEPTFGPGPRVIRHVKFGAAREPNREPADAADFALKPQVAELFEQFAWVGDAVVHSLVVRHGLPFTMDIEGVD